MAGQLTRALVAKQGTAAALTPREREIVVLVAQGNSNRDIAKALVISERTARTHVSHAMAKLGARDRAQLVVIAYQTGLVSRRL